MALRETLNAWLSIVLKFTFIVVIILAVLWGGLSVWANVHHESASGEMPKMPSISKASTQIFIRATGRLLLAKDYDVMPSPRDNGETLYILRGYYEIEGNKWKWRDVDLSLDEYYFGPISVKRRVE